MTETAFYHAALAVAAGMAVQAFAARFSVPSIVLLLAVGVAIGPDGVGLLDPGAFGAAVGDLVTLAVTVILFEGGLALNLEDLRRQQRSLSLLLTLGALISMVGGTVAAHFLLDMPWSLALLYGALVIVTGPTVVTPLLSRLSVDLRIRQLLVSEGVLIDPVGAIVAIVAADAVVGHAQLWAAGWLVFARLGVGGVIGGTAGVALAAALRRDWVPDRLRNPTVLGVVLLVAALASRVSSEAGLMAAVVQGVVMANAGLRELGPLRQFKEELTVFLLSFIFVVLAAKLPLAAVGGLGWNALLVVGVLAWVARPLAVFLCTVGADLSVQQRLFISWICPRGIVAASVAGLFGILLSEAQVPGGERLEALVFVTVALTVAVQGLTARPVARALGVDLLSLQGTIIVGADQFGRLIGRLLVERGRQVVLIDSNPQHCDVALAQGLPAYEGDALSVEVLEEAGVRYADTVLAVTTNQELNMLIAQRVRDNFRIERILAATDGEKAETQPVPFPGAFPGPEDVNRQLRYGRTRLIEYAVPPGDMVGQRLGSLSHGTAEFILLLQRRDRVYLATSDQKLAAEDRVLCVAASDRLSPLQFLLNVVAETDTRELERTAGRDAV